jgi:hypothetical protein
MKRGSKIGMNILKKTLSFVFDYATKVPPAKIHFRTSVLDFLQCGVFWFAKVINHKSLMKILEILMDF